MLFVAQMNLELLQKSKFTRVKEWNTLQLRVIALKFAKKRFQKVLTNIFILKYYWRAILMNFNFFILTYLVTAIVHESSCVRLIAAGAAAAGRLCVQRRFHQVEGVNPVGSVVHVQILHAEHDCVAVSGHSGPALNACWPNGGQIATGPRLGGECALACPSEGGAGVPRRGWSNKGGGVAIRHSATALPTKVATAIFMKFSHSCKFAS
jgi:hypothetical protein